MLAQFAGAIGAAAVIWGLYGSQARSRAYLGATYPAAGAGPGRVFAAEAVVTFVLILVIISMATDRRVPRAVAAMAIGAALAVAILIGGALAVTAYDQILRRGSTPDANNPATAGPEPT